MASKRDFLGKWSWWSRIKSRVLISWVLLYLMVLLPLWSPAPLVLLAFLLGGLFFTMYFPSTVGIKQVFLVLSLLASLHIVQHFFSTSQTFHSLSGIFTTFSQCSLAFSFFYCLYLLCVFLPSPALPPPRSVLTMCALFWSLSFSLTPGPWSLRLKQNPPPLHPGTPRYLQATVWPMGATLGVGISDELAY